MLYVYREQISVRLSLKSPARMHLASQSALLKALQKEGSLGGQLQEEWHTVQNAKLKNEKQKRGLLYTNGFQLLGWVKSIIWKGLSCIVHPGASCSILICSVCVTCWPSIIRKKRESRNNKHRWREKNHSFSQEIFPTICVVCVH